MEMTKKKKIIIAVVVGIFALGIMSTLISPQDESVDEIAFRDTQICVDARDIVSSMEFMVDRDEKVPVGRRIDLTMLSHPTIDQKKAIIQNFVCESGEGLGIVEFASQETWTFLGQTQTRQYGHFTVLGLNGPTLVWDDCEPEEFWTYEDGERVPNQYRNCSHSEVWSPILPE